MRARKRVLIFLSVLVGVVACSLLWRHYHPPKPLKPGFTEEFAFRADGIATVERTYAFSFDHELAILEPEDIYQALLNGKVDVISGFRTSGYNKPRFKLVNLKDDQRCFPEYLAIPLLREDALQKNPWLEEVISSLKQTLPEDYMVHLNYRVEILHEAVADVARGFLERVTLPRLSAADAARSDELIIGSKNFTEAMLLAEIMAQAIERVSHLRVVRKIDLGGTRICFMALLSGEIDLYAEYTGTLWGLLSTQARRKHPRGQQAINELRRRLKIAHAVAVLDSFGFENTFTLTMRQNLAKKLKFTTITDLAQYVSHNKIVSSTAIAQSGRPDQTLPGPLPPAVKESKKELQKQHEDQKRGVVEPRRKELSVLKKDRVRQRTIPFTDFVIKVKTAELVAEEAMLEITRSELEFIDRETDPAHFKPRQNPDEEVAGAITHLSHLQQLERALMKAVKAWKNTAFALRRHLDALNEAGPHGLSTDHPSRRDEVIHHLATIHYRQKETKAQLKLIRRHIVLARDQIEILERISRIPAAEDDLEPRAARLELIADLAQQRADAAASHWAIAKEAVQLNGSAKSPA